MSRSHSSGVVLRIIFVAPRRTVAEQDLTQALDVELDRLGELGEVVAMPIIQLVGHPLVREPLTGVLQQRPVRVAANGQSVQPHDQVERLDWERPAARSPPKTRVASPASARTASSAPGFPWTS